MSDTGDSTQQKPDTRPFNFDDPSLTDVDQAAIDAIGQDIQEQLESGVAGQFLQRGATPPEAGSGTSTTETTTTPSVDGPPAGSQPSPATSTGEGTAATTTQTTTDQTTDPGTFSIPIPGLDPTTGQPYAPVTLTAEQALVLLQEHQYYANQPRETLEAWGAIEQGTHAPVALQEYAAFKAWQQAGSPPAQPTVVRRPFDTDDVTPEALAYIERLESATTNPTGATQQTTQQQQVDQPGRQLTPGEIMQQQQEAVNRQIALQQALATTKADFTKDYSLDANQLAALEAAVAQANIIPAISAKYRVMNPLGTGVMSEGDPITVFKEAFESVMATHPTFRPIRDEAIVQRRLAQNQQVTDRVNGKKAAAGSLAHVPSATVHGQGNTQQKTVEQMTPQERQSAMVAELAELMASGQAIN